MVMKALRDGASGGITKIFLFGFMVAAVGGLVFMDVGGVFRGGISKTEVIKVGDDTVKIATFDRNLRRALSRVGMSPQDAYKLGYVQQVIGTEVRTRLLDNAARDHDIKVSDKAVAEQVAKLIAPLAKNNKQDPKDVLFQILRMQGMSEKEFSQNIAMDMGNSLMLKAIQGGFTDISDDILKDLFSYANETRDIEYIAFLDKDIEKPQAPSEEELQQLYDATKKNYAIPERRKIQLITIDTSKLEKSLTISDEEIKNTYENNIEQYTTPENWKLDQALVTTKEQADKIYEETKKGKDLKKAVEKVTSNTSSYMETQEIPENGLLPEIKDAVIAAETSTVLEPIKSPLGWHIVHIQAINKEHIKPLPEVKNDIKKELSDNQLIDQQYELANRVDDMLAGGATLDEVKDQVDLIVEDLPEINQYGLDKNNKSILQGKEALGQTVLETAFSLLEGETAPVFETDDGKFMTLHVAKITPQSYTPFEDVKDDIQARWMADQTRMNNKNLTMQKLKDMQASGSSLQELAKTQGKAVKNKSGIARGSEPKGDLLSFTIANLFEAPVGEPIAVDIKGGTAIAVVKQYNWPEADKNPKDFKAFKISQLNKLENEALGVYLKRQQDKYRAIVNDRLLNQVYGPESQAY